MFVTCNLYIMMMKLSMQLLVALWGRYDPPGRSPVLSGGGIIVVHGAADAEVVHDAAKNGGEERREQRHKKRAEKAPEVTEGQVADVVLEEKVHARKYEEKGRRVRDTDEDGPEGGRGKNRGRLESAREPREYLACAVDVGAAPPEGEGFEDEHVEDGDDAFEDEQINEGFYGAGGGGDGGRDVLKLATIRRRVAQEKCGHNDAGERSRDLADDDSLRGGTTLGLGGYIKKNSHRNPNTGTNQNPHRTRQHVSHG